MQVKKPSQETNHLHDLLAEGIRLMYQQKHADTDTENYTVLCTTKRKAKKASLSDTDKVREDEESKEIMGDPRSRLLKKERREHHVICLFVYLFFFI